MSFHPRQTSSDVRSSSKSEDNTLEKGGEESIACDGDTSEEEPRNENRALPPATRLGISGSRPPDLNEGDDDNDDEIVAGRKMERSVLISDNVDDKVIEPKGNSFDDTLPSTTGSYLAAVAMGRKTKTNSVNQNKNKSQLTVSIHGTVAPSAR